MLNGGILLLPVILYEETGKNVTACFAELISLQSGCDPSGETSMLTIVRY
jgi:hypothetical protein